MKMAKKIVGKRILALAVILTCAMGVISCKAKKVENPIPDNAGGVELSNPNATKEAKELYAYLQSEWGKHCLTGQQESTWMGSPDYEMDYIEKNTGKLPAIRGLDFMHNDFDGVAERAMAWWEKGGIVTICWHTGPDFASEYKECIKDEIDWKDAFTEGSETYNQLVNGMDRCVPALLKLQEAGVPVLWRPFHETDGNWFWWSKGGSENLVKLWQLMYDRYTNKWGLNNLIWVFGYSHMSTNAKAWYPGDEYVDLTGADCYEAGANPWLYQKVQNIPQNGMPIVYHECGNIPSADQVKEANTCWLYFMTWHTEWLTEAKYNTLENLKAVYNDAYYITLDELPKFD